PRSPSCRKVGRRLCCPEHPHECGEEVAMTHMNCSSLTRLLTPIIGPVFVVAALGCRETESPTAPEAGPALATAPAPALSFRQVSGGAEHSCGVTIDDRVYCWGRNNVGQLGDGTTTPRLRPALVASGLRFLGVSAGAYHTCAVATDNRAYCWGFGAS